MRQDLSFALRQLLSNRTFGAVAVLTLALAIAANTAIFSAVDAVLLHPLPYPNPEQLVSVVKNFTRFSRVKVPVSPPEVLDFRAMATCFSVEGAVDSLGTYTLTGDGDPEVVPLMHATAGIFQMLGVKPTKYRDLAAPPEPVIYLAASQSPGASISLALRTAINPLSVLPSVRATAAALDPNVPVAHVATVDQRLASSVARQRFSIELMVTFATISALLAAIGIYGVLAYIVDQRPREFGIRRALGSPASNLRGLVLRQGALPIGTGIVLGIGGAIGLSRVLKSLLYEVSPLDPVILVMVSLVLAAIALAAVVVPANRAAQIDPLEVLRSE